MPRFTAKITMSFYVRKDCENRKEFDDYLEGFNTAEGDEFEYIDDSWDVKYVEQE